MEATSSRFRICQSEPSAGRETESSQSIPLEEHFGEAKRLVNQHEYGKAMEKYLSLIAHGNTKAMSEVSLMLSDLLPPRVDM